MPIAAPGEGRDFCAEDVGGFLQKTFGDRLSETGEPWYVNGVTVDHDKETGWITVSGLEPAQYGTGWTQGVPGVRAIAELFLNWGYSASYEGGLLKVLIPESEFGAARSGQLPVETARVVGTGGGMAEKVEGILSAEKGFPIG